MGKKSKKKGGATNKAARKEKLQERREQQLEEVDNNQSSSSVAPRQYFEGDRVWFVSGDVWGEGDNPNNYRGIVKCVLDGKLDIIPLQSMIDGHNRSVTVPLDGDKVFPDFCDMTLRFDVGDRVLCYAQAGWSHAKITYQWPIMEIKNQDRRFPNSPTDMVPRYKCDVGLDGNNPTQFCAAPEDEDYCIKEHPSSFRFDEGDNVIFKCKLPSGVDSSQRMSSNGNWISGIVKSVDITGMDKYAAYTCSCEIDGKQYIYHITKDNDACIAKEGTNSRSRLFEAIEQGCTRDHIMYLVQHYNIDVTLFRDLVVSKAIEYASYQALCWLHHDCNVNTLQIKDESGNNLLHKIASSENATRFIKEAGRVSKLDPTPDWKLNLTDYDANLISARNNDNDTWLMVLVKRGNAKALDAAFSPHCGLAWELGCYAIDKDGLSSLKESVQESNDIIMQSILDSFVAFRTCYQQYNAINMIYTCDSEKKLLESSRLQMHLLQGEDALINAKRLTRFFVDWQRCSRQLERNPFTNIVVYGHPGLFELFFQADESVLLHNEYSLSAQLDRKEFIQPELTSDAEVSNREYLRGVNVWTAVFIGAACSYYTCTDKDYQGRLSYLDSIRGYILQYDHNHEEQPSLISYFQHRNDDISKEKSYASSEEHELVKHRLSLLVDDKTLDGRLKVLDHLIQQRPNSCPDVLVAIRHRQCGVLRFMVDKGLVKMEANASSNRVFTKQAPNLKCLEKGRIPSSMTAASFLSFVAVEYDDLQTLQWLCESYKTISSTCDGWNLLHFSAYMGRVEIVAWLYTQPEWQTLVTTVSKRKPFQHAYAVHIAASEGHVFLADFLLALKYHFESGKRRMNTWEINLLSIQIKDTKGKLPEFYAKKSSHEFVKEWAAKREKPLVLQRNVSKLLKLVNENDTPVDKVKQFIITSKCLDPESWKECKYYSFDEKHHMGVMGVPFGDVLRECCSKCPDADFVDWLCTRIYFKDNSDFFGIERFGNESERPVELVLLSYEDLLLFAEESNCDDLAEYLSRGKQWLKDMSCADPATVDLLLMTALSGEPLTRVRAKLLQASILATIARCADKEVRSILRRGGRPEELGDVLQVDEIVKQLLIDQAYTEPGYVYKTQGHFGGFDMDYIVKPIDMSLHVGGVEYPDEHPLYKQIPFRTKSSSLSRVYTFLVIEGHTELLEYCVINLQGWTLEMELKVIRLASYFGNYSIMDICVKSNELLSSLNDRYRAAMCGAGEALRYRDLVQLVSQFGAPEDLVFNYETIDDLKGSSSENEKDEYEKDENIHRSMSTSLLCSVLNGYLSKTFDQDAEQDFKTLHFLVNKLGYTNDNIIFVLEVLWESCTGTCGGLFFDVFQNIMEELNLQPFMHHKRMRSLCKTVAGTLNILGRVPGQEETESRGLEWLDDMAEIGIDIQQLLPSRFRSMMHLSYAFPFPPKLCKLEEKQLLNWATFNIVKRGESLQEIQSAIEQGTLPLYGRDRGGLMLTHLSAAYDRVDLLDWLVLTKGMDIKSMDGQSRTVLDVAKASKATSSTKWITELQARRTIASFTQQNYHRLLAVWKHQRLTKATTFIQTIYRGYMIRKLYSGILVQRLEESQRFSAIWGHVIQQYNGINSKKEPLNWSSIRESVSDINQVEFIYDDSYFEDTDEKLSNALEGALQVDDCVMEEKAIVDNEESNDEVVTKEAPDMFVESTSSDVSWLSFQMTSHVVKFLKNGDPKYKSFFVRRMQQLGSGERSRILQKRLKGSQSTIYETYLEQKSGFRILWTEEGDNIVIWFVAKHKEVSRLMQLIDDSKSRTARQQLSESVISDLRSEDLLPSQREAKKEVLLDVFSNVPLKLYDVSYQSIDDIATSSWSPKLHLTDEERDVVEANGTVLVLGRSGTGKTVCICNRMEYDRQVYGQDSTFSQLFVARSKRLCRYVSEATGNHNTNSFHTFDELVYDLETSLPSLEGSGKSFFPSQRVDFMRFKQEFYSAQSSSSSKEKKISAMILWTAIRTFIKGSIEAHQSPDGILPKDDFIAVEKLGKNRCRVPVEYRASMYDEFLKYEEYKAKLGLWDDIDRIQHLLSRLDKCMNTEPAVFDELRKSKIYVDEVQDYTQIEILLFFYLGGPGGLFLAGDPAQSVVEGTEFRFEEIRSVGYHVAESSGNRDLIPSKAKTVNVNFRSHAGILNAAGSFLDYLFKYFPGSAKQLKKDYGLFQGSRPGVLYKVKTNQLATLLSDKLNGTVVLVHDKSSDYWRKALGGYKLVYGIREAKGLEFKSVMILDFFSELPSSLHKPWRNLLLDREGQDFETKYPLVGTHLKLLYTGITRCIERLFFVETSSSIAGDTLVRWLKQNELATKNNINDIESMAMTSDEFLCEGFNNAEQAESADELDLAYIALDRAVWCFEQANNLPLAAKARTNRRSIKFRLDLLKDSSDEEMIEVKGAQIVESLMREGLLLEIMNVYYSISPFMREYSKEQLESVFISKIRLALA